MKLNTKYINHMEQKIQKPFLKWVGGKTQILQLIIDKIPTEMNNYHEIFLGGGSVLFAILSLQKQKCIKIHQQIYAYDINEPLIYTYKNIQTHKDKVFEFIHKYMKEYDEIEGEEINKNPTEQEAKTSKESYYYWLRSKYNSLNKKLPECSALFMIINKLCFRGMYREGPNGYNIPFGHYKKTPTIITRAEIDKISEMIKEVRFECCDFHNSLSKVKDGDFVYLDPPYVPENPKSFVGYTSGGFGLEKHKQLFEDIINVKNVKFLLSNSRTPLVLDYFKNYEIDNIVSRRAINSKNPASTTNEILILNMKRY